MDLWAQAAVHLVQYKEYERVASPAGTTGKAASCTAEICPCVSHLVQPVSLTAVSAFPLQKSETDALQPYAV